MGAAMTTTDRADYALITRRAGLRAGLHVNACRRWLMCCASAYTVRTPLRTARGQSMCRGLSILKQWYLGIN